MEEKKTSVDTADTSTPVVEAEPTPVATTTDTEVAAAPVEAPIKNTRSMKLTIVSVLIVVVALAGTLYVLEKDGRVNSTIFSSIIAGQEARAVVATVNGESITAADLEQTATQLAQAAIGQGVNPADPTVQASIQSQALDLVIGTRLLLQTAAAQGIVATDEDVATRISEIEVDAGGAEQLALRMEEFGITAEALQTDVRSEIIITRLLEAAIADLDTAVTDEELLAAYEGAGGAEAGLPPFAEVRPQIEAQLTQMQEQAAIEQYVSDLRTDADIEIVE